MNFTVYIIWTDAKPHNVGLENIRQLEQTCIFISLGNWERDLIIECILLSIRIVHHFSLITVGRGVPIV